MWLFDKIKNIKQRIMLRRIDVLEEDILGALNISDNSQNTLYRETEITEEDILGALQESTNQSTYLRTKNNGETSNGSIQQRRNVPPTSKTNSGKTYAISDIHGMYGSYMEVIQNLNENDTLFVIGDVIDRGKNGIKILQDMMKRKNVKFILGNHEWQMIQVLDLIRKYNLSEKDIANYIKAGEEIYSERDWISYGDEEEAEKCRKKKEEYLKEIRNIQLDDYDMRLMYIWTLENSGIYTLDEFLKLAKKQQDEIYEYVTEACVMARKQINNKNVIMVHASPLELESLVDSASKKPEGGIKYSFIAGGNDKRLTKSVLAICTETRNKTSGYAFWKKHGYKTIYGHTQHRGRILVDNDNDAVDIDAGCAYGGKLALYCLDDESVKYIDPREDYIDNEKAYRDD